MTESFMERLIFLARVQVVIKKQAEIFVYLWFFVY